MRDVIAAIVALVSLAWLLAIVASPVLPAPLAAAVYRIGSHICHQRPERSFHLFGAQLAVCARCIGIYTGAVVGAAIGRWVWPQASLAVGARRLLVVGAIPTAVTGAVSGPACGRGPTWSRCCGLPLGIAVGLVVMRTVATLHYGGCAPRRPIASNRPPTPI